MKIYGVTTAITLACMPLAISAVEIGPNDQRIDNRLQTGDGPRGSDVTFNPDRNEFMIVWSDDAASSPAPHLPKLVIQRVDGTSGLKIGAPQVINTSGAALQPRIHYSTSGNSFLLLWTQNSSLPGCSTGIEIFAIRLAADGVPLAPEFGVVTGRCAQTSAQFDTIASAITADGTAVRIAWKEIVSERLGQCGPFGCELFRDRELFTATVDATTQLVSAPAQYTNFAAGPIPVGTPALGPSGNAELAFDSRIATFVLTSSGFQQIAGVRRPVVAMNSVCTTASCSSAQTSPLNLSLSEPVNVAAEFRSDGMLHVALSSFGGETGAHHAVDISSLSVAQTLGFPIGQSVALDRTASADLVVTTSTAGQVFLHLASSGGRIETAPISDPTVRPLFQLRTAGGNGRKALVVWTRASVPFGAPGQGTACSTSLDRCGVFSQLVDLSKSLSLFDNGFE